MAKINASAFRRLKIKSSSGEILSAEEKKEESLRPGVAEVLKIAAELGESIHLAAAMPEKKPKPPKQPKAEKPPKLTKRELAAYEQAPDGMDQKEWELAVCMEKLTNRFIEKNKERFGTEIAYLTGKERAQLRQFYLYWQSFEKALPLFDYVFDNWYGIKPRYRVGSEYPTPGLFATSEVIKQIANEFHKKTNVTREDIVYDW